jgi:hypothetical protein
LVICRNWSCCSIFRLEKIHEGASVEAEDMVNPVVMKSDVSQGDMVNNLAFASGGTRIPTVQVSCFCNGAYQGVMSHKKCADACKPARRRR